MKNKVQDVMSRNIYQVKRTDPISRARKMMSMHRIKSVFVVEDQRPVGMVIVDTILQDIDEDTFVEEVMLKNTPRVPSSASIQTAAKLLLESGMLTLPVIDDQELMVGVLRESDIVKDMAKESDLPKLSLERVAIYLSMTEDREHEKYWLERAKENDCKAAITQVGESAERLAVKLREAAIVAAIAKGVISEELHEKIAVSNAVRDVYSQISLINPGLGGGFKVAVVRTDRRITVAVFGKCGHALANGPQTIAAGFSII